MTRTFRIPDEPTFQTKEARDRVDRMIDEWLALIELEKALGIDNASH